MRLIDADKLIARFKKLKGPDILMNIFISDVIKVIKQMPTAYDIDKVVEKFDKRYNNSLWIKGNEEFSITRNELIEIVKQVGVSDDVCEWSADKIKVTSLEVIVNGSKRKPYYEIKYKEVGADHYNIGYSSYNLDFVLEWKEKCFELVKAVE